MADFDYNAPTLLYPSRSKKSNRPVGYRRFDTGAEAIRFAIEVMPSDLLLAAVLDGVRELYDGAACPPRAPTIKKKSM